MAYARVEKIIDMDTCFVKSCNNTTERKYLKFYKFPTLRKESKYLETLSRRRQKVWRLNLKASNYPYRVLEECCLVCSIHFESGVCGNLEDEDSKNWAPFLYLDKSPTYETISYKIRPAKRTNKNSKETNPPKKRISWSPSVLAISINENDTPAKEPSNDESTSPLIKSNVTNPTNIKVEESYSYSPNDLDMPLKPPNKISIVPIRKIPVTPDLFNLEFLKSNECSPYPRIIFEMVHHSFDSCVQTEYFSKDVGSQTDF